MPKKALILKDFTSGLVYSEHGADLPNNSISQGGNFNINRRLGVLELAGKWQEAVRPDDVAQDGTTESFQFGGNFVGIPGRGLFYFTSDYSDMKDNTVTGGAGYSYFFDYDNDRDLDVYLVNHAIHTTLSHGSADVRNKRVPKGGDVLLQNQNGNFVDVSEKSGIFGGQNGYGLSASISDFNNDGLQTYMFVMIFMKMIRYYQDIQI